MNELSQENFKNLTKLELKTELSKQDLALSRKKENLVKRFTEILNQGNNKLDKPEKHMENVGLL